MRPSYASLNARVELLTCCRHTRDLIDVRLFVRGPLFVCLSEIMCLGCWDAGIRTNNRACINALCRGEATCFFQWNNNKGVRLATCTNKWFHLIDLI